MYPNFKYLTCKETSALVKLLPDEHQNSIIELNVWIKDYSKKNHFIYLVYYSLLVDDQKGMKKDENYLSITLISKNQ